MLPPDCPAWHEETVHPTHPNALFSGLLRFRFRGRRDRCETRAWPLCHSHGERTRDLKASPNVRVMSPVTLLASASMADLSHMNATSKKHSARKQNILTGKHAEAQKQARNPTNQPASRPTSAKEATGHQSRLPMAQSYHASMWPLAAMATQACRVSWFLKSPLACVSV